VSASPPCRLHVAVGPSCGPVAVSAVTRNSSEEVNSAILRAASEDGEHPTHLNDTDFRHQARAAELLGWDLFTLQGAPLQTRALQKFSISKMDFTRFPTISEFVQQNRSQDILLGQALSPTGEAHTFAVDRGWYFDNNTGGEIVTAPSVPAGLANFRVVRAVALRRRTAENHPAS
jgi:hypothetical protein